MIAATKDDDGAPTWRIEIVLPSSAAAAPFEAAFDGIAAALTTQAAGGGSLRLVAHCTAEPDRAALAGRIALAAAAAGIEAPAAHIEALPATDWVAAYRERLAPQRIGRFFIHPADFGGAVPDGAIAIRMESGLAFGTGSHESTRGCLAAFDRLAARRVRRALDMGCGSGILSIAAAKLWGAEVLACDNDPVAVRIAAENAALNGVGSLVRAAESEGYGASAVGDGAPYGLIAANILAAPLIAMAGDLARVLADDGVAVLSGILDRQAEDVTAAHAACGLALIDTVSVGEWSTLVLGRR